MRYQEFRARLLGAVEERTMEAEVYVGALGIERLVWQAYKQLGCRLPQDRVPGVVHWLTSTIDFQNRVRERETLFSP